MARTEATMFFIRKTTEEKQLTLQTAPTQDQLQDMMVKGYFDRHYKGYQKIDTGEKHPCPWFLFDNNDLGLLIRGKKYSKPTPTYTPGAEYIKYVESDKQCNFDSTQPPSTVAYIEEGYPPHTLKVYSGVLCTIP